MTGTVIAFPNSPAQPVVQHLPLFSLEWVNERGDKIVRHTTDQDAIRRQLTSCLRRKLFAAVRLADGSLCGGVHAVTELAGQRFIANFQDISWGE